MISFFKRRINIHTDNLQRCIVKKTNNSSLSGKSLEKLVSIANTQYGFKNGEADFIFRGIPCSTNGNYEKVSKLITEIKSVKPVKEYSFINSRIHSWEVKAKELLKMDYNPEAGEQLCVKQSSTDINHNKTTDYDSNGVTSSEKEKSLTRKFANLNIKDQIKSDCRPFLKDVDTFKQTGIIKRFLKKSMVSQVYGEMFSNGEYFKKLNIDLPASRLHSFDALQHLNKVSTSNFKNIKEKIGTLDEKENKLMRLICDTDIFFQHRSPVDLALLSSDFENYEVYDYQDRVLSILSNKELNRRQEQSNSNTREDDIRCLHNHDFVFFNCEFAGEQNTPMSKYHNGVYYGSNSYVIGEDHEMAKYGYMTLSDHKQSTIFTTDEKFTRKMFSKFPDIDKEIIGRDICQNNNIIDTPIYTYSLMKPALALHLIDFLRGTKSDEFKKYIYNESFDRIELHKVLNTVFSPEFHIPRSIYAKKFMYND